MFQLDPITPCPIIVCHREEPGSILVALTLYIFININKVTPQSPLLQTKETQLPQPFFIREVLHSLNHLCCPALDPLQQFPVLLELRGPELDTIFQVWSPQGRAEGQENLSDLLTTLLLIPARVPLAFLATRAQCWLMVILLSTRTPTGILSDAT